MKITSTHKINGVVSDIITDSGLAEATVSMIACTAGLVAICADLTDGQVRQLVTDVEDVISAHIAASRDIREAAGK